jgi:hypothetical protein
MPQARDQIAKQKAPGGVAVQANDDGPLSLVDEMHAVALRRSGPASADRGES